jgi:hypothetical protein
MKFFREVVYEVEADTVEEAEDIWAADGPECGGQLTSMAGEFYVLRPPPAVHLDPTRSSSTRGK